MTEKTATKIMHGYQISLAVLMLICMTILLGYNLIAGRLNLFTFACFSALWVISYKMLRWSITECKEDMKQF